MGCYQIVGGVKWEEMGRAGP